MTNVIRIISFLGLSLAAVVCAIPQVAVAEDVVGEARQALDDYRATNDQQDTTTGDELDTDDDGTTPGPVADSSNNSDDVAETDDAGSDEERARRTVTTIDGAETDTEDDRIPGTELASESVDQAYDAALIRTDIELEHQYDQDRRILDDSDGAANLDPDRVQRLRALIERLSGDEDSSQAIIRIRQMSEEFSSHRFSHLPLQPYVPDPRWTKAMQLLADEDCDEALHKATQVLGPPEVNAGGEPAIAYAFARMQLCADDNEANRQGRATMNRLADHDSTVGHLAQKALGRSGTHSVDDEALGVAGHIRAGNQLARDGDVDGALEQLADFRSTISGGWDRHRVRLAEARILEDAGRIDEAAMAYRGIYRKTRSWRSSDRIASEIENAEQRLDRQIITFGDRVDRMRALISRARYRQARAVSRENAQIRGVSGREIRGWTRYRQALQNERQRNRERAASQFKEANDLIEDPVMRPRLYFGWARALRRTGGDTEAIELYDRICEEYPDNTLCDRALYEAGRLHQYQNNHDEARDRFSTLVGLHPFSDKVADALWRYALSAYLQDDFDSAIAPLKTIVAHYGDQQDASELTIGLKARYWIGTSYLKAGDHEQARHWLQNTIDHGPLTWYGLLAITRLEDAQLPSRVPRPTAQLNKEEIENFATLRIPDNPRLTIAAELTRIGLYDEALSEVRSQLGVYPAPEGGTQLRAALHLAVGEPNWAHWIMKSVVDEGGPTHRTLRDWGFAFPLDYFELSHQSGQEYGVSPHLVHAIMRQESGFRPTVSSPAGAMGLMQLMPGTARYTARTFFEGERLSNAQILDEATNVRLGTMYIRIHQAHAADQTSLALAGYNAGPAPLKSWHERFGDRELDAWVESITYRETRGYVRKVMTSYITYKGLYGDGGLPDLELTLPDELRDWGQVPEVEEIEEGEPVSLLVAPYQAR